MLPPGWSIRATVDTDAHEVLALVHDFDIALTGLTDTDLHYVRHGFREAYSAVVTDARGTIMAWGTVSRQMLGVVNCIVVYCHPANDQAARLALFTRLVTALPEPCRFVRTFAVPADTGWISTLEDLGFSPAMQSITMSIALPSRAADRRGIDIAPVRPDELATFHGVLSRAYADDPEYYLFDYQEWLRTAVQRSEIDDQWLTARINGTFVGALQAAAQGDQATIHHVVVLPEYRRRGVGRALLQEALQVFSLQGRTGAIVGINAKTPTALNFFAAAGMTEMYRVNTYDMPFTLDLPM